jgi:hypothetical protein
VPAVPFMFSGFVAVPAVELDVSVRVVLAPARVGVTVAGLKAQVMPVGGVTHAGVTEELKPWSAKKVTTVVVVSVWPAAGNGKVTLVGFSARWKSLTVSVSGSECVCESPSTFKEMVL